LPDIEPGHAYHVLSNFAYTKVKYLIESTVASGLIFLTSSNRDFKSPEIRPYIDKYMRGSNGYTAIDRAKLLKLLWDAVGTEFGGRHELYEINYGGSSEEIRRYVLFTAQAIGTAKRIEGFAESCLNEYDIDGWKVPDLKDPEELSYHALRGSDGATRRSVSRPSLTPVPSPASSEPAASAPAPAPAPAATEASTKAAKGGGFANPFARNVK
jgi:4-hydroxyphenylacetate 3-monooxygenase